MYDSKHEFPLPHETQFTYFSSDPSDAPPTVGTVGSPSSEIVPFCTNAPKPVPLGLSCDCVSSAKYTLSAPCFNRTAVGNEDRSVNAAKVQVRT